MATNTGPQGVQSDTNASGLSTKLKVLIATNTKYRNVIIITKGKKGANRYVLRQAGRDISHGIGPG